MTDRDQSPDFMTAQKICKRCKQPVIANAANYEIFEQMHWLCFHLEFEHGTDPDRACGDPSCPWWHIEVFRNKLEELGVDPDALIKAAIETR